MACCRLLLGADKWIKPWDHTWVYELDSSSSTKFSRHIIVRVPGRAFANCSHVGAFVGTIMAWPEVGSTCAQCQLRILVGMRC